MNSVQARLFPDPKPLVETLGVDFFRCLPESPGIYLMKDLGENIVYVGKAKNLRKRLNSYRVANPDRLPRRLLRLLNSVRKIDCEICESESKAIARESDLLQTLKPKFNRAGTWPSTPRFILFRATTAGIEMQISTSIKEEWNSWGPFNSAVFHLHLSMVRLIFISLHSHLGFTKMPMGWFKGVFPEIVSIPLNVEVAHTVISNIELASKGQPESFLSWVRQRTGNLNNLFDAAVTDEDITFLNDTFVRRQHL